MSPNSPKAFLIYLDGTLAGPLLQVSPPVAKAVKGLAQRLAVSIVSSRSHTEVGDLAGALGLTAPQISEGGTRIFDPRTGQTPWLRHLAAEDARRIMAFLERNKLPFAAVDGHAGVSELRQVADWRVTRITATSLAPSQAKHLTARFGALPRVHTSVIVRIDNGDWMVDFTHADATKATAVARYADLMGIQPTQIAAAGDSYNDLPLLSACGLRIAMGNAVPELKAMADYMAPSVDEDGLAVAIQEFVLPRL